MPKEDNDDVFSSTAMQGKCFQVRLAKAIPTPAHCEWLKCTKKILCGLSNECSN
jgi:hypothetical protein